MGSPSSITIGYSAVRSSEGTNGCSVLTVSQDDNGFRIWLLVQSTRLLQRGMEEPGAVCHSQDFIA